MFLILGTRLSQAVINVVSFVCGYCGVLAPQHVVRRRTKFTLFFLPLFTVATRFVNECTNCGGVTELTAEQARHSVAWVESHH
jgi:hypothetical protein